MRLHGPRGQYIEIHIEPEYKEKETRGNVIFEVKNDFFCWKNDAHLLYGDIYSIAHIIRRDISKTDTIIENKINCRFEYYVGWILDYYQKAVQKDDPIKNYYVPKDFTYAYGEEFIFPLIKMDILSKEKNKSRYIIFFELICPYDNGHDNNCFVEIIATEEELLKFAYDLECEISEIPYPNKLYLCSSLEYI